MTEYNLPDGCTIEQINREMFVDERSCLNCLYWNPIAFVDCDAGICEHLLNKTNMSANDIAENSITKRCDVCRLWEYFE